MWDIEVQHLIFTLLGIGLAFVPSSLSVALFSLLE
jgi:hypothetical protein